MGMGRQKGEGKEVGRGGGRDWRGETGERDGKGSTV